jgi:hypothetical protein
MLKTLAKNMVNINVSPAKILSQTSYLVTGMYYINPTTPFSPPPAPHSQVPLQAN